MSESEPLPSENGGLPGPIGEVFGAFEPRFYGVSLRLETPEAFQAWMSYSDVFPQTTPPKISLLDSTCLQTAGEHETRHFHDALISPFANGVMMLRLSAGFNGAKVFSRGMQTDANCVPVPITAWLAKDEGERAAWIEELAQAQPPIVNPPVRPLSLPLASDLAQLASWQAGLHETPDDPKAALQQFAMVTMSNYAEAAGLMRGPTVVLRTDTAFRDVPEAMKRQLEVLATPRNFFEANALAVQLQAAWTNIGQEAAESLVEYLMNSDIGYAQAFCDIARVAAPPGHPMFDPIRIAAVATWSLLGDILVRDDFDPAVRFSRLRPLLTGAGIESTDSVASLWDEWDRRLGLKSWRQTVTEMHARTQRSASRYRTLSKQSDETHAAAFATVAEAYVADQDVAIRLLLDDPNAYVDTRRYVESTQGALPIPLMSVELGVDLLLDRAFIVPLDEIPSGDAWRFPGLVDENGKRGWFRSVVDRQVPPRPGLLDAALEVEFSCKICDTAFSAEALSPFDKEVLTTSMRNASGLTPFFVF